MKHNIDKETRAVRQALQPGKMPVGILLGAGCPLAIRNEDGEPLIPDVAGLTAAVGSDLEEEDEEYGEQLKTLRKHLSDDGADPQNIEVLLTHIRILRIAAGSDAARGLKGKDLETLDTAICKRIVTHVNKSLPNLNTPYHRLAKWVGGVPRNRAVEIFTTNYDLLAEQALEEVGVPYFDGFSGARRAFFDTGMLERPSLSGTTDGPLDELPARWARIWKLHGSINWYRDRQGVVFRGPVEDIELSRLIYPSHLKYSKSQRMPYLAMFDRFAAFLRQSPCVLVSCGYSFSDEHVNAVMEDSLRANPSAVCYALLFDRLSKYDEAVEIGSRRPNLNLLAADGAVIGGHEREWERTEDGSVHYDQSAEAEPNGSEVESDSSEPETYSSQSEGEEPTNGEEFEERFVLGDFAQLGEFLEGILGGVVDSGAATP